MHPSRSSRWFAVALVALSASLAAPDARADNVDPAARSTARKLGQEALKLFESGDYAAALEKFNTADSLVPAPTLGLYAARCLVKLGRPVEASERYLEVTRMQLERGAQAVMRKAQADAVGEREKLLQIIPTLEVRVEGPQGDGVVVVVDDKPLLAGLLGEKRPVNPGKHKATAKRADVEVSRDVDVVEKGAAVLLLKLPPLPLPPVERTPPLRVAGWVGIGVGIAGAVLGGVSGGVALAEWKHLDGSRSCKQFSCGLDEAHHVATYDVVTKLTTVGILTSLAGLGVGVPLLVVTPRSVYVNADGSPAPPPKDSLSARMKPRVAPWVTWGGAGVRGIF